MEFDPNNDIVKLCAQGMEEEGKGNPVEARRLFVQAWNEATNDFEKFTAAHYVARHQETVNDKLLWDETALHLALRINNDTVKESFPSLYLNIAKCYEDLNDLENAKKNYHLALSFTNRLPRQCLWKYGKKRNNERYRKGGNATQGRHLNLILYFCKIIMLSRAILKMGLDMKHVYDLLKPLKVFCL